MTERKRVLILTADVGFGHRSAANALSKAFEDAYHDRTTCEIVNPFDDPASPSLLRDSQTNYDDVVTKNPELYKLNYTLSDSPIPAAVIDRALTVMLLRTIGNILKRYRPSVVISTHPFYMAPMSAYLSLKNSKMSFVTVVTDLTNVHRLWFNQGADLVSLPTQEAFEQGIAQGFPPEHMVVTGIPVNPQFANESRSPDEIRAALGWTPGIPTALVLGSKRIKGLMETMHVLNHSGLPFQYVLVAGGDDELFESFKACEWHPQTYIYNFVNNMPEMMCASDVILGKAGGLTATEAMACGRPLLIVDVTPGQEEGNVTYVESKGAGARAEEPVTALECLYHWMDNDRTLLQERARIAQELGRPRSAYEVAKLTLEVAETKRDPAKPPFRERVGKVKELLKTFDISLTESD